MLVVGLLKQPRIALQRGGKRRLDGHKQQDEIQAMQAFQALVVLHRGGGFHLHESPFVLIVSAARWQHHIRECAGLPQPDDDEPHHRDAEAFLYRHGVCHGTQREAPEA